MSTVSDKAPLYALRSNLFDKLSLIVKNGGEETTQHALVNIIHILWQSSGTFLLFFIVSIASGQFIRGQCRCSQNKKNELCPKLPLIRMKLIG